MCFSATASFSVAAILLPAGVYCVATAQRFDSRWTPLAAYPIAFGLQQATEGVLWLGINSGNQAMIAAGSHGFLFFTLIFWLSWVPFSIYRLEDEPWRRKALIALTVIGTLFGLMIFMPIILNADWLNVEPVRQSLHYKVRPNYDNVITLTILRLLYALIVVSALALSTDRRIRIFCGLIVVSFLFAYLFFAHALVSVWCFFAAILSGYIVAIIMVEQRRRSVPV